mmetsp:Transcript_41669/g.134424  ORF Transcript_41669/g.134424 Transcript_41669/m.134424 type:complete len:286 (+) Transcript_41669:561-1418(+)
MECLSWAPIGPSAEVSAVPAPSHAPQQQPSKCRSSIASSDEVRLEDVAGELPTAPPRALETEEPAGEAALPAAASGSGSGDGGKRAGAARGESGTPPGEASPPTEDAGGAAAAEPRRWRGEANRGEASRGASASGAGDEPALASPVPKAGRSSGAEIGSALPRAKATCSAAAGGPPPPPRRGVCAGSMRQRRVAPIEVEAAASARCAVAVPTSWCVKRLCCSPPGGTRHTSKQTCCVATKARNWPSASDVSRRSDRSYPKAGSSHARAIPVSPLSFATTPPPSQR